MNEELVDLARHVTDIAVGGKGIGHVDQSRAAGIDQDIGRLVPARGQIGAQARRAIFQRDMQFLLEEHDMRGKNDIEGLPFTRQEPVEQRRTMIVPARKQRIEMRIVDENGIVVFKQALMARKIDGVELGIADHPDLFGGCHAARHQFARGLGPADQNAVEPALVGMERDHPVARAMGHIGKAGAPTRPVRHLVADRKTCALGADDHPRGIDPARMMAQPHQTAHRGHLVGQGQRRFQPAGKADVEPGHPAPGFRAQDRGHPITDGRGGRRTRHRQARSAFVQRARDTRDMRHLMGRIVIEQKKDLIRHDGRGLPNPRQLQPFADGWRLPLPPRAGTARRTR